MASSDGPPDPTTRHVLLTLAVHMDSEGGSCWPSTLTLATETGLHRVTVTRHLQDAETSGWVTRKPRVTRRGKGYSYYAAIPPHLCSGGLHTSPLTYVAESYIPPQGTYVAEDYRLCSAGLQPPVAEDYMPPPTEVEESNEESKEGSIPPPLPARARSPVPAHAHVDSPTGPMEGDYRPTDTATDRLTTADAIRQYLHLGHDTITVHGQDIGIGLEILHLQRLARQHHIDPHTLTLALSILRSPPVASDVLPPSLHSRPVSLALFAADPARLSMLLGHWHKRATTS